MVQFFNKIDQAVQDLSQNENLTFDFDL